MLRNLIFGMGNSEGSDRGRWGGWVSEMVWKVGMMGVGGVTGSEFGLDERGGEVEEWRR